MSDSSGSGRARARKPPRADKVEQREEIEGALAAVRERVWQLQDGELQGLAEESKDGRLRGVLRIAEGIIRQAVTRVRVSNSGKAYGDPDLNAANKALDTVVRVLGLNEENIAPPQKVDEEQLRELLKRAGYEVVRVVPTTGEEKPDT